MSSPLSPFLGAAALRKNPLITTPVLLAISHHRYCKVVTGGYSLARVGCISIIVHCDCSYLYCLVGCVYVTCNYSELHGTGCTCAACRYNRIHNLAVHGITCCIDSQHILSRRRHYICAVRYPLCRECNGLLPCVDNNLAVVSVQPVLQLQCNISCTCEHPSAVHIMIQCNSAHRSDILCGSKEVPCVLH